MDGKESLPKKKRKPPKMAVLDSKLNQKGRLPDGATYELKYDAVTVMWAGCLTIPGPKTDGYPLKEFRGKGPALFALLGMLDREFRAWREQIRLAGQKV